MIFNTSNSKTFMNNKNKNHTYQLHKIINQRSKLALAKVLSSKNWNINNVHVRKANEKKK